MLINRKFRNFVASNVGVFWGCIAYCGAVIWICKTTQGIGEMGHPVILMLTLLLEFPLRQYFFQNPRWRLYILRILSVCLPKKHTLALQARNLICHTFGLISEVKGKNVTCFVLSKMDVQTVKTS